MKCPPLGDLLIQSNVCLVTTFGEILFKKTKERKKIKIFFFPFVLDTKEKESDLD